MRAKEEYRAPKSCCARTLRLRSLTNVTNRPTVVWWRHKRRFKPSTYHWLRHSAALTASDHIQSPHIDGTAATLHRVSRPPAQEPPFSMRPLLTHSSLTSAPLCSHQNTTAIHGKGHIFYSRSYRTLTITRHRTPLLVASHCQCSRRQTAWRNTRTRASRNVHTGSLHSACLRSGSKSVAGIWHRSSTHKHSQSPC